ESAESVFLGDRRPLVQSSSGATIYEGASRHYYYRGIRAGSFDDIAPVTIDVTDGSLSEDRLLDMSVVMRETGWAFRTATSWDETLMNSVLSQSQPGEFWVETISAYTIHRGDLPKDLLAFIAERRKSIRHPAFLAALDAHMRN